MSRVERRHISDTLRRVLSTSYILPLVVNCVFAYSIFVLDVIRLVVNIGQHDSRHMLADRHVHGDTCRHAYMHVHIHAYILKYSCCFCFFWLREMTYNPQSSRQIVAGPAEIELAKFRQRQHHQLPVVQHVRFTTETVPIL